MSIIIIILPLCFGARWIPTDADSCRETIRLWHRQLVVFASAYSLTKRYRIFFVLLVHNGVAIMLLAITINKGIEIELVDDVVRAKLEAGELVQLCRDKAKSRLEAAGTDPAEIHASMDDLVQCVEAGVADTLAKANEEIAFQANVRKGMAAFMENYTCTDPDMNTTEPVREENWIGAKDNKKRFVKIMLDRPASKIHVIEDFISPEECVAMEEAAKPKLHRATVADGKGGSEYSESRKAMQAGIRVNWSKEASGDHIAILSRRVYDYANHVLGLNIEEHGQEDLMSIQYFGRGANDTSPDRYTPHCDGDCTGLPHKMGTRMATVVMYW